MSPEKYERFRDLLKEAVAIWIADDDTLSGAEKIESAGRRDEFLKMVKLLLDAEKVCERVLRFMEEEEESLNEAIGSVLLDPVLADLRSISATSRSGI